MRLGSAQHNGGSGVAAEQRLRQIAGTVCECAYARPFEHHQCANVHVFNLGRGWRDNGADGIVIVGGKSSARGNVHQGCQCAAAADGDTNKDDTANADGDTDDIEVEGICNNCTMKPMLQLVSYDVRNVTMLLL